MFDKEQDIGGPGTIVGSNVKLNGVLKDLNDITIHGSVDGEVISEKNVLVSETAAVKGPITAQVVTISGKAEGTVTANKKLEITPTGKLYGSIATKDLVIRSGAVFVGKSTIIGHSKENSEMPKVEEKIEENIISNNQTAVKTEIKTEIQQPVAPMQPQAQVPTPAPANTVAQQPVVEKKSGGFWDKFKDKPKYEVEK